MNGLFVAVVVDTVFITLRRCWVLENLAWGTLCRIPKQMLSSSTFPHRDLVYVSPCLKSQVVHASSELCCNPLNMAMRRPRTRRPK